MFFKNLTLFRFSTSAAAELEQLDANHLRKHAARACGPLEMRTRGWVSPFGRGDDRLSHTMGNYTLLSLGGEDKLLPSAVVNEALGAKLAALAEERGKPVGGRERKRIKDEIWAKSFPENTPAIGIVEIAPDIYKGSRLEVEVEAKLTKGVNENGG